MSIITYFRSSSYAKDEWCEHAYTLNYVLGLPEPANQKAEKGNIVHKALELIGRAAKAEKEGKKTFDAEDMGILKVKDVVPNHAFRLAYDYYLATTTFSYNDKDFEECLAWTHKVLDFDGGKFDPRKLNLIDCEVKFDAKIPHEWAKYSYKLPNNKILEGQLGIKGTIDVVAELKPGVIELLDWKTGRRWDWNKSKIKDYNALKKDSQLLLYFYAAKLLFPEADHVMVTIYFINDGGPYTMYFDNEDIAVAEKMLQNKFEKIRDTKRPRLDISWKCKKLCHFGKTMYDEKDTICEHFRKEFIKKTPTEVLGEITNDYSHLTAYGDGGGRQKE